VWKVSVSIVLFNRSSVRLSIWNNKATTGRLFVKFHIGSFLLKTIQKIYIWRKYEKITDTLHKNISTFMTTSVTNVNMVAVDSNQ